MTDDETRAVIEALSRRIDALEARLQEHESQPHIRLSQPRQRPAGPLLWPGPQEYDDRIWPPRTGTVPC